MNSTLSDSNANLCQSPSWDGNKLVTSPSPQRIRNRVGWVPSSVEGQEIHLASGEWWEEEAVLPFFQGSPDTCAFSLDSDL